jgi:hypothetical protein
VKTIVSGGYPITFVLDSSSYGNFGTDDVLGSSDMECYINHVNTVVGYDDAKVDKDSGEQGAFKCVNSWGKDFGPDHNGYYWITYAAFLGDWNTAGLNYVDCKYVNGDHPTLLAVWEFSQNPTRNASITVGIGSPDDPFGIREPIWNGTRPPSHYDYGTHFSYPSFMCLDITEFLDEWHQAHVYDFFLQIGDALHNGRITSFTVEYYKNSYKIGNAGQVSLRSTESPDTPSDTPCIVRVLNFGKPPGSVDFTSQ